MYVEMRNSLSIKLDSLQMASFAVSQFVNCHPSSDSKTVENSWDLLFSCYSKVQKKKMKKIKKS